MVLPIVFALGALVCAALNDIVFRKYASLRLSVGWYVSTIGFSWALLQLLLDLAAAGSPRRMHALQPWRLHTLMWAPALALVLANILLIEALVGADVGGLDHLLLNTVGVVLGGWVLLGEQLRAAQIAGVAGVAAIMLLYRARQARPRSTPPPPLASRRRRGGASTAGPSARRRRRPTMTWWSRFSRPPTAQPPRPPPPTSSVAPPRAPPPPPP